MVSRNLLYLNVVTMAASEDSQKTFQAKLSAAEVNDQLPRPGLEFETVYDIKIDWVRAVSFHLFPTEASASRKGNGR